VITIIFLPGIFLLICDTALVLTKSKTKKYGMNFFKAKTTWSNAEFIPLKLCIASIYVVIGSYFHDFFSKYYTALFILFGITVIWSVYLWIKKMEKAR